MCHLLNFDSENLMSLLKARGINGAWIDILATHLRNKKQFLYILNDDKFKNANFLDTDLLSELSIGEISVLYEYSLSYDNRTSRQNNGQFFTPDDVAELMAKQSSKFETGIWLDPCSGIGNLSWHLIKFQSDKEKFLINNLILSDTDELALFIARVLFTISFQRDDENLFNTIKDNFKVFDFISVADSGNDSLFLDNSLNLIPQHDFVIVNPPYLATDENPSFETAKCTDLYAYFLENIIKTSKGFISITPQSFTNAAKFYSLRKLLLDRFNNLTIYNFDNVPDTIFHGIKFGSQNTNTANSVRASIIVALPHPAIHRITSLLRWKTNERKQMLESLDLFLSEAKLTPEYFPKVNKVLEPVFNALDKTKVLGDLLSDKETSFVLYIPSSPRYFIPALKKSVQRSSLKTLYFKNQNDLDFAYGLLNSSLLYWWWRIRDGGMTLSLETIKSLPIVNYSPNNKIIKLLEKSESENRVYKINCGVAQENVKHPMEVLKILNDIIVPDYSDKLLRTHQNSELVQLAA
ncbi:MAG: N-6 DNA methylase [Rickettsiales bacterium]|jgi:hypothetical protein|nr:N-6 DNA methylase [Rickettsiales bacterium]